MAEIDTRPLESVQAGVALFDPISDQLNRLSPDRNEEEIVILTKELATSKLQLEVKENESKQAILKIEALQKAMHELSDKYNTASLEAHNRITQLEADNGTITSQQSAMAEECNALKDELAVVKGELDAAKASIAFLLKEVELMQTRTILERESTKEALARILQLNETILSSAVAAIRAEEERSVFFQEVTLEFFNSDKNLEVIRRQMEMMESMEEELLAKTVEIQYLKSELKQVKELYVSPQVVSDATVVTAGCGNSDNHQVQVCETSVRNQEAEAEFTFQNTPEGCFVSEIFRNDCQVVPSDDTKMEIRMSEEEDKQGAEVIVQDTTVLEGNSDAQETRCLVAKILEEDHHAIQPDAKNIEAENNQEPEADVILPNSTACDVNLLRDHEEPKADASFVLESSRDDFQSVHSDGKGISIAMPENVAGNQEAGAEAAASTSTPGEGKSDACIVATEIAVFKDEDEFYTKELEPEQGSKLEGYVLVAKSADADAVNGKLLDAARAEISDLRFSLEEAMRRAELAEEAKAALERELREEIRNKHPSRRRAASDSEDARRPAREGAPPTLAPAPAPFRSRPTPSRTPGTPSRGPRNARPGGEDMPTSRCLTLGKVLKMK